MTNKTQITQLYGILLEAQLDLDNLVEKELKGGRFLRSARCKCSAVMAYSNLKPFKEIQPCISASSLSVTHFVHEG
jgi:hypothetical protein